MRTSKNGAFTFTAVCRTKFTIQAEGFEKEKGEVEEGSSIEFELLADPAESLRQMISWQATGNYKGAWSLVHPDAHAYVVKQEWIEAIRDEARSGYASVGVDVKRVTFVKWTLDCTLSDFAQDLSGYRCAGSDVPQRSPEWRG